MPGRHRTASPFSWQPVSAQVQRIPLILATGRGGAREGATGRTGGTGGAPHAGSHTLGELQLWDEAGAEAAAAARDERAAGHTRGLASAIEILGLLRLRQWRFLDAYDCFDEAAAVLDGIRPADEGAADVPRARALRGLGRLDEAQEHARRALAVFRANGEAYNTARALTDLAEILLAAEEPAAALPLTDEAIRILSGENADQHVEYLRRLRERCSGPQE